MCQVLSEAVQIASRDIVEDLDNDNGYISLKISADSIVSETTINHCFALGALCTIFMIKAYAALELIFPALIQAAIGNCHSVQDRKWVQSISPPLLPSLTSCQPLSTFDILFLITQSSALWFAEGFQEHLTIDNDMLHSSL